MPAGGECTPGPACGSDRRKACNEAVTGEELCNRLPFGKGEMSSLIPHFRLHYNMIKKQGQSEREERRTGGKVWKCRIQSDSTCICTRLSD